MKALLLFIIIGMLNGCAIEQEFIQVEPVIAQPINRAISPVNGGTLHVSMRNPQTLNPVLNTDPTIDLVLGLIFEDLFVLDQQLRPIPNLAESLEFNEELRQATIVLRDDIFWADGTPITATDVIFTIDLIRSNPTSLYHETVYGILSVVANSTRTITVTFRNDNVGGRYAYKFLFPVVPRHYYQGGFPRAQMNPLGSGPFKLYNHTLARDMMLVQNEYSFRDAHIEQIHVIFTPDLMTDLNALSGGLISALKSGMSDFGSHSISVGEFGITSVPTNNFDFIGFNFINPILADNRVRQAISHAIISDDNIALAYMGQGIKTASPVNPLSYLYAEGLNYRTMDLDTARALLIEAGFTEIDTGGLGTIVVGVHEPLSFRILVNEENVERVALANILRQNLENIGVLVDFMVLDFESYMSEVASRNFDLLFAGANLSLTPDLQFIFNNLSYNSTVLNGLLYNISSAQTSSCYKTALKNLQRYLNDELPIISVAFRNSVLVTAQNVHGEFEPQLNGLYSNIGRWFIY